jgi:hypothetical protein
MYRICICDILRASLRVRAIRPWMFGLTGDELERPSTDARRERGRLRITGGLRSASCCVGMLGEDITSTFPGRDLRDIQVLIQN